MPQEKENLSFMKCIKTRILPVLLALSVCASPLTGCAPEQPQNIPAEGGGSETPASYSEQLLVELKGTPCRLKNLGDGQVSLIIWETAPYDEQPEGAADPHGWLVEERFLGGELLSSRSVSLQGAVGVDTPWSINNVSVDENGSLYLAGRFYGDGGQSTSWILTELPPEADGYSDSSSMDLEQLLNPESPDARYFFDGMDTIGGGLLLIAGDYRELSGEVWENGSLLQRTYEKTGEGNFIIDMDGNLRKLDSGDINLYQAVVADGLLFALDEETGIVSAYPLEDGAAAPKATTITSTRRQGSLLSGAGTMPYPYLIGADREAIYYIDQNGINRMVHGGVISELLVEAEGCELGSSNWSVERAAAADGGFYVLFRNHNDATSRKLVYYSCAQN